MSNRRVQLPDDAPAIVREVGGRTGRGGHAGNRSRHRQRPCGTPPAIPANVILLFDTVDMGRHDRIRARVQADTVNLDVSGHATRVGHYELELQSSADGVTPDPHVRKIHVPDVVPIPITAATAAASVATFTNKSAHHYQAGDDVKVSGMTPSAYNGTWTVLASGLTNTQWKANIGATPGAGTSFGESVLATFDVVEAVFHGGIRKWRYYRARAEGVDFHGCTAGFSPWTGWASPNDNTPPPDPINVTFDVDQHDMTLAWKVPREALDASIPDENVAGAQIQIATDSGFTNVIIGPNSDPIYRTGEHARFKISKPTGNYWARVRLFDSSRNKSSYVTVGPVSKKTPNTPTISAFTFDANGTRHARYRALVTVTGGTTDPDAEINHLRVEFVHKATNVTPTSSDRRHREGLEPNPDATGDLVAVFRNIRKDQFTFARVVKRDTQGRFSLFSAWTSGGKPSVSAPPTSPASVTITHPQPGVVKATWPMPADDDETVDRWRCEVYKGTNPTPKETGFTRDNHYRYDVPDSDRGTYHTIKVFALDDLAAPGSGTSSPQITPNSQLPITALQETIVGNTQGAVAFGTGSMLGLDDSITLPVAGFALPSLVQVTENDDINVSSLAASAFDKPPIAGNLLVAHVGWRDATATISSFTGGWTHQGSDQNNGGSRQAVYTKVAAGGDAPPTVTLASAVDDVLIFVAEFDGVTGTVDKTATNSGTTTPVDTGTTAATTQTVELLLGFLTFNGSEFIDPPSDDFVIAAKAKAHNAAVGDSASAMIYKVVQATGAAHASFEFGAGTTVWVGRMITLLASGSALTPPPTPPAGFLTAYGLTRGGSSVLAIVRDDSTIITPGIFTACRAYKSGTQSVTSGSTDVVTFAAEDFDSDALHDTVTNNSRFVVPTGFDGLWHCSFWAEIDQDLNAGNGVGVIIRLNAAGNPASGTALESKKWQGNVNMATWPANCETFVRLVAGDYVEAFLNSIGEAHVMQSGIAGTWFLFERRGP